MNWCLAFMLIAACSAARRHPTLVVVETRTYHEHTASGEARVLASDSPHARLAAARAWLAIAESLSATPADAYEAATRGANELGSNYAARGVREETFVHEMAAKSEFGEGHDDLAAHLMIRVLRSRIAMYRHRYAPEVE